MRRRSANFIGWVEQAVNQLAHEVFVESSLLVDRFHSLRTEERDERLVHLHSTLQRAHRIGSSAVKSYVWEPSHALPSWACSLLERDLEQRARSVFSVRGRPGGSSASATALRMWRAAAAESGTDDDTKQSSTWRGFAQNSLQGAQSTIMFEYTPGGSGVDDGGERRSGGKISNSSTERRTRPRSNSVGSRRNVERKARSTVSAKIRARNSQCSGARLFDQSIFDPFYRQIKTSSSAAATAAAVAARISAVGGAGGGAIGGPHQQQKQQQQPIMVKHATAVLSISPRRIEVLLYNWSAHGRRRLRSQLILPTLANATRMAQLLTALVCQKMGSALALSPRAGIAPQALYCTLIWHALPVGTLQQTSSSPDPNATRDGLRRGRVTPIAACKLNGTSLERLRLHSGRVSHLGSGETAGSGPVSGSNSSRSSLDSTAAGTASSRRVSLVASSDGRRRFDHAAYYRARLKPSAAPSAAAARRGSGVGTGVDGSSVAGNRSSSISSISGSGRGSPRNIAGSATLTSKHEDFIRDIATRALSIDRISSWRKHQVRRERERKREIAQEASASASASSSSAPYAPSTSTVASTRKEMEVSSSSSGRVIPPDVAAHAFVLCEHIAVAAKRSAVKSVLSHLRRLWHRAERGFVDASLGTVDLSALQLVIDRSHSLRQWRSPTFFWDRGFDRQWLESFGLRLEENIRAHTLVVVGSEKIASAAASPTEKTKKKKKSGGGAPRHGASPEDARRSDSQSATVRYLFRFCRDSSLLVIRIGVQPPPPRAPASPRGAKESTSGFVRCDIFHCCSAAMEMPSSVNFREEADGLGLTGTVTASSGGGGLSAMNRNRARSSSAGSKSSAVSAMSLHGAHTKRAEDVAHTAAEIGRVLHAMHCSSYLFDFTVQRMHTVLRSKTDNVVASELGIEVDTSPFPTCFVSMVHTFGAHYAKRPPLVFARCRVTQRSVKPPLKAWARRLPGVEPTPLRALLADVGAHSQLYNVKATAPGASSSYLGHAFGLTYVHDASAGADERAAASGGGAASFTVCALALAAPVVSPLPTQRATRSLVRTLPPTLMHRGDPLLDVGGDLASSFTDTPFLASSTPPVEARVAAAAKKEAEEEELTIVVLHAPNSSSSSRRKRTAPPDGSSFGAHDASASLQSNSLGSSYMGSHRGRRFSAWRAVESQLENAASLVEQNVAGIMGSALVSLNRENLWALLQSACVNGGGGGGGGGGANHAPQASPIPSPPLSPLPSTSDASSSVRSPKSDGDHAAMAAASPAAPRKGKNVFASAVSALFGGGSSRSAAAQGSSSLPALSSLAYGPFVGVRCPSVPPTTSTPAFSSSAATDQCVISQPQLRALLAGATHIFVKT